MTDTKLKPNRKKTGGRAKGVPNKTSVALKDAIMNAFEQAGGESYLLKIAIEDPKTFCTLLARILPSELSGSIEILDKTEILAKARKRVESSD